MATPGEKKSLGRAIRQMKVAVAEFSYEDLLSATPGWPWQMSPQQYAEFVPMLAALEHALLPQELAAAQVPEESRWPWLAKAVDMPLDRFGGLMKSISGMLTLLP